MSVEASMIGISCDEPGCEETVIVTLGISQAGLMPPFNFTWPWLAGEIAKRGWRSCQVHGHRCPEHFGCEEREAATPSGRPN